MVTERAMTASCSRWFLGEGQRDPATPTSIVNDINLALATFLFALTLIAGTSAHAASACEVRDDRDRKDNSSYPVELHLLRQLVQDCEPQPDENGPLELTEYQKARELSAVSEMEAGNWKNAICALAFRQSKSQQEFLPSKYFDGNLQDQRAIEKIDSRAMAHQAVLINEAHHRAQHRLLQKRQSTF